MKKRNKTVGCIMILAFLMTALSFVPSESRADTCVYIPTDFGDDFSMWDSNYGWKCNLDYADYWMLVYGMGTYDWDDGFGWHTPCDIDQPMARILNALWHLYFVGTNTPTCDKLSWNMTLWAGCYADEHIPESVCRCGSGTATGTAATSQVVLWDEWVEFYWPFFYGMDVSVRAGAIVHEARHLDGCWHNGFGCTDSNSCDISWEYGCNWNVQAGANTWEVYYLATYVYYGWRTTRAMKDAAVGRANLILENRYMVDPCFRISWTGAAYSTC